MQKTVKELTDMLKEERKLTATMFADKFQSDLDNYIAAHKLEWSESDEAVRDTLEIVIKELRGAA